jgi:hypothetical protein
VSFVLDKAVEALVVLGYCGTSILILGFSRVLMLVVSRGPPTTTLKESKKAYWVGRPLQWLVRS